MSRKVPETPGLPLSIPLSLPSLLDSSLWLKLLMLAKCILASPAFGHRLRWREILKLVKSRLRRWADGEYLDLWSEAVENSQAASHRKRPLNIVKQNANRALRATQNGQYSKAIKSLTSEGAAPADEEVLEVKHPQVSTPVIPPGPTPSPIKSTVVKGVKSFPPGSAPGLRPSHLREAILCPSPDYANRLLFSLTGLVNLLASGHAPPTILPHLCGATLIAIWKKGGGLRPIAIGESLRRLTSKCLAFSARPSALPRFLPNQLGVGVKGGCEAIIHTVSSHF